MIVKFQYIFIIHLGCRIRSHLREVDKRISKSHRRKSPMSTTGRRNDQNNRFGKQIGQRFGFRKGQMERFGTKVQRPGENVARRRFISGFFHFISGMFHKAISVGIVRKEMVAVYEETSKANSTFSWVYWS